MKKFTKKDIPNALTLSRVILSPFSLIFVFLFPSKFWFFTYLAIVHSTDIFDGYLARKFNAVSHFGRKFDSYADYIIAACLIIGVFVFMGKDLISIPFYFILLMAANIIPAIVALVKLGHIPQLHLQLNKINWFVAAVFIFLTLFIEFYPTAYLISVFFYVIAGVDRIIFYLLLRDEEDMKIQTSWQLIQEINKRELAER